MCDYGLGRTAVDFGCFAPLNAFLKVSEEKGLI